MDFSKVRAVSNIIGIHFIAVIFVVLMTDFSFAHQNTTYVLGEIGDMTISEGELLDFKLKAPEGFGPDVTWTVTGLPEEGIFYEVPAFPGAEGFGVKTSGGRGGRVVKVTNLNREGEGSLAAALALEEPRIIVFDVSGVIEGSLPKGEWLENKAAKFYVANAPVTIAGQTAPGAGITLNGQLALYSSDGGVATDNSITRFLRLRSPYHRGNSGDNVLAGGNRAVFDHVSGAWGNDENFDLSNLRNASFQWCGVEESAGYGTPWEVYTDRDADGMFDYWERKVRDFSETDEIKDYIVDIKPNEDLDGDGDTNLTEFNYGTNPLVAGAPADPEWIPNFDSDGDGLADWWEEKAINENDSDDLSTLADIRPGDDLDGDLSTNLEEHEAGTTPVAAPRHNFGMIMGYKGRNISLHHNFFAHHQRRTPLSGVSVMDQRNNVIYNCSAGIIWHGVIGNYYDHGKPHKANVIGNTFKPGPNEPKTLDIPTYFDPFIVGDSDSMFYAEDNNFDMIDEPSGHLDIFDPNLRRGIFQGSLDQKVDQAYSVPEITTHTAEAAYDLVMVHAGCLPRDTVTQRNVNEIITRTGKWGKEVPEKGLMEGLNVESPPIDTDNDGMPDDWETASFRLPGGSMVSREMILDPSDGTDYSRIVKSGESVLLYDGEPVNGTEDRYKGYTYIEYYINEKADQMILKALKNAGYNETDLPGYGKKPSAGLSWNPDFDQAGDYQIKISASDGAHEASETLALKVMDTNRTPLIYNAMYKEDGESISGHLTNVLEIGKKFLFEFYVQDIDGDAYEVHIENMPVDALATKTGRTQSLKGPGVYDIWIFEWTPKIEDIGWADTITFTISDSEGASFSKSFSLEVTEPTNALYTIVAETTSGGSISPSGEIAVQEGSDWVFEINAEPGYAVMDILIDGVSTGALGVGTYVFENISGDHSIKAIFDQGSDTIGNLVMQLDFDGDMLDGSGLGNHGTPGASAPTSVADRFGNSNGAYSFDGIDDYIIVPDSPYFDSPEYTLTAWVYGRKDFYKEQYMISKNTRGGTNSIGMYAVYNSIYTCGSGYPHTGPVLADEENQWMHIAVVRKLSSVEFFLNGAYQGTVDTVYNEKNDLNLFIGAQSGPSEPSGKYFDGIIDEVRLFSRALSQEEIAVVAGKDGDWVPLRGDLNSDGKVDESDLDIVANAYGAKPDNPNWNSVADLNRDGVVDLSDLVSVASNFGATD